MLIVISVLIIVVLMALFFITYVLNKNTPVPAGCEDLVANNEKCGACNNRMCRHSGNKEE